MNIGRSSRETLGNTAQVLSDLKKDVAGKGLIQGTGQLIYNIGNTAASQVRQDIFTEVAKKGGKAVSKNGKKVFNDKTFFRLNRNRDIVGETNRGSYIVRSRKRWQAPLVAFGGSGASIGAASYALGDKTKSKSERATRAAAEGALFGLSVPAGMAYAVGAGIVESKKAKKLAKKQQNQFNTPTN